MAITETNNTGLACIVILWKASVALRRLSLCSQKLSAGANKNDAPEIR